MVKWEITCCNNINDMYIVFLFSRQVNLPAGTRASFGLQPLHHPGKTNSK